MAPRPILAPLRTPKNVTYPSELQDTPLIKHEDSQCEAGNRPSVLPPKAYTEFLKALSPAYASPEGINGSYTRWMMSKTLPSPSSVPSTASTVSFSDAAAVKPTATPPSPSPAAPQSAKEPTHVRRPRISPSYIYSPVSLKSPRSPYKVRTPYSPMDRRAKNLDSPLYANSGTFTIQHVVTHTVTFKRAPSLEPPPKGKRRRTQNV
ncbi:hypothetical protein BP00DRAFT_425076 [Aspergillus indologenus CBS 114.80]|uniref:Uncharacterized protein n=1 Tax=Aspergillus indologenus CBS 114.80 TaxID=1450541 RepID=A0A2V5I6C6_9EURO|nr:hypothetical protein BP00DRAFT_425076 [Aspergillus indologenus CBS 114.80]